MSVLIPVWNDARFLPEAVESVRCQTFGDIEILLIDDGSTDSTPEVVEAFLDKDQRIRSIQLDHVGLAGALNRGIQAANGEYIARLDADDRCVPGRVELQVEFMQRNPEIAVVGSCVNKIDEAGRLIGHAARPLSDLSIRWKALLWCPFTHSAVMLRRATLDDAGLGYDETLEGSEDYDLWSRLLRHGQGANLSERLVDYRIRDGMSTRRRGAFEKIAVSIAHRMIESSVPSFTTSELEVARLRSAFAGMGQAQIAREEAARELTRRYAELFREFVSAVGVAGSPAALDLGRWEASRFISGIDPALDDAGWLEIAAEVQSLSPLFLRDAWPQWSRRIRYAAWRGLPQASLDMAAALPARMRLRFGRKSRTAAD